MHLLLCLLYLCPYFVCDDTKMNDTGKKETFKQQKSNNTYTLHTHRKPICIRCCVSCWLCIFSLFFPLSSSLSPFVSLRSMISTFYYYYSFLSSLFLIWERDYDFCQTDSPAHITHKEWRSEDSFLWLCANVLQFRLDFRAKYGQYWRQ